MTELLIWANFLIASTFALWRASHIDARRLTFIDGLLIGMIYYLVLPMVFILTEGRISAQFIRSEDYYPYSDLDTTLTILLCLYFIPIIHFIIHRPSDSILTHDGEGRLGITLLVFMTITYFSSTILGFILSGLWSGGHWYTTTHEALSSNGLTLILRHLANFSRTAIFGLLVYTAISNTISIRSFHLIAFAVVICDLLLTFNRITAAYYLIGIILLHRRNRLVVLCVVACLIFVIPLLSNMWPMFRSLATKDGYTIHGLISAAATAYRSATSYVGLADFTGGVFESINITVLNYVVKNQSGSIDITTGSIYLRPLTIFLPSLLWSDRPVVFGTILGSVINNDTNGLALNSTLLGEPYGNFGAWWPVGIAPMYLIYHFLFQRLARSSCGFGAIGAFCAIAMWRFDSTIATISLVLSLVLMWSANLWLSGRTRTSGTISGRIKK